MIFRTRFRMLFTLLLSLIVPAGSASADMRFNFENCYKFDVENSMIRPIDGLAPNDYNIIEIIIIQIILNER